MLARREEARVVKRRREEMGAEVKPEVCIVGGGDVRRWWGGRGGCVAFWVELMVGSWIEARQFQLALGNLFRRTRSGRSSGTAINRYTRYGNPQGCPSDTHKVKISNCTPRRPKRLGRESNSIYLGQIYLNTGFFTRFSNSHSGREGKSSQSTATWYELRQ